MTPERRAPSIRLRLLARMAAGFLLLLMIISFLLWNYSRTAANKTYDLLLSGAALSILERVSVGQDGATVDIPGSAMEILGLAPRDRLAYAVFSFTNGPLTGADDLPMPLDPAASATPVYFDAPYMGSDFRFIMQSRPVTIGDRREWIGVLVGQTREARWQQQLGLFGYGMAGLAAVSLIGLAAVWLAITTALRPLQDIEQDLVARKPSDLTEVSGDPPSEIASLFGAINSFIARLAASRSLNESFIADVAHQVRTSLSALLGQVSLAADSADPAEMQARLTKAEAQAQRSIRLTNQLLANAMVIHRSEPANLSPIALTPLVRGFMTDFIRDSVARDATFSLDAEVPEEMDSVLGDTVSIREALRNIVENSLRHGPSDTTVDIDLRLSADDRIVLSVSDSGPGIPEELRQKATERFVSLRPESAGSGLGLAIVSAVASSHQASLRLGKSTKGGLRVALEFPRYLGVLLLLAVINLAPQTATADPSRLVIYSATDTDAIAPLLEQYEADHPDLSIDYREYQTRELYELMLDGNEPVPDVVISSAMDLQVDLVNRGLAQRLELVNEDRLPDWAHWRSELFGFTFEPAAIAYNPDVIAETDLPRTHQTLARYIRANQDRLYEKVGTYDVTHSGIGYLFATQEQVQGLEAQRMTEVLGRAGARLYCCTAEMLNDVATGELGLAVNVISSYALAFAERNPTVAVFLMDDYNLVMSRAAYVPMGAANPVAAGDFVDFLISAQGQDLMMTRTELLPLSPSTNLYSPSRAFIAAHDGTYLPIPLRPSLLTYLDRIKQDRFIDGWMDALQMSDF